VERTPPAAPGPDLPDWADARDLDPAVRASLRGLDSRNAETVARHLVVAGTLVDEDPERALAHARAARDRASRIAVVREAVGVAAYHAGDFAEASRELRAYRRMSGDEGYRAVLADCERAQGRPEVAVRLVREALADGPDRAETVELHLVEAGARRDLGEAAAARLVLEGALGGRPTPERVDLTDEGTRRLASAYADLLAAAADPAAGVWAEAVAAAGPAEDEDVAFGEEELPATVEGDRVGERDRDTSDDTAGDTDDDTGGDTGGPVEDDGGPSDPLPAEDAAEVGFDDDVEREVAELLGEIDPEDDPGH
jgi:tetratricopeptide (TPR) repeat protein